MYFTWHWVYFQKGIMSQLSLRNRIFLSYLLLIVMATSVIGWIANRQIRQAAELNFTERFYEHYDRTLIEMDGYVYEADLFGVDFYEQTLWEEELPDFTDDLGIKIELLALDGSTGFYDTEVGRHNLTRDYPDVLRLINEEEELVADDTDAQTRSLAGFAWLEDEPFFIVRMTESFADVENDIRSQTLSLVVAVLIAGVVLVLGVGGLLARALTRPLTDLRQSAQAMADGKLDTRVNNDNVPIEVRLLAQDFNQMAEQVEAMVSEQKAFASNAAHELRTPLTGIRLRLETLIEDKPEPEILERYLLEIDDEVRRLSKMVEDLRVLSRVDAERLKVGNEQVNIGRLLDSLQFEFATLLRDRRTNYTVYLPEFPLVVTASQSHVRVVLRNLLENAIKYTPEGGRVTVSAQAVNEVVQVWVEDDGVGITAENLPHVFTRFYRADKSRNRKTPGTGLGLSLAHAIVQLYGGGLTIHSDGRDQGTTAIVTLPVSPLSTKLIG